MTKEFTCGILIQSLDRADERAIAWLATRAVELAADMTGYPETGPVRDAVSGVRQSIGGVFWRPAETDTQLREIDRNNRRNVRRDINKLRTAASELCQGTNAQRERNPYFRLAIISSAKAIAFNNGPTERLIGPISTEEEGVVRPVREDMENALEELTAMASNEPWPITFPTPNEIQKAAPALQVAWDAVSEKSDSWISLRDLAFAFKIAEKLGLDWNNTLQRAIAERCTDEERLSRLLSVT